MDENQLIKYLINSAKIHRKQSENDIKKVNSIRRQMLIGEYDQPIPKESYSKPRPRKSYQKSKLRISFIPFELSPEKNTDD
jgi:hypothetical protein